MQDVDLDKDERNHRVHAEGNFQTEDEHVFAIGDSALIDQPGDQPAPPTAQAAWQAADVAGENLARAVRGQPLMTWTHNRQGGRSFARRESRRLRRGDCRSRRWRDARETAEESDCRPLDQRHDRCRSGRQGLA